MVHDIQNHWVPGLCPSSAILKAKMQRFGNWIFFRLRVSGDTLLGPLESYPQSLDLFPSTGVGWDISTLLGPLERANLNYCGSVSVLMYGDGDNYSVGSLRKS
jgi:hypothetical protein